MTAMSAVNNAEPARLKRYIMYQHCRYIMASSKAHTSISLHTDVLHRLQDLKTANQTWDDFLLELTKDYVPRAWVEELERRAQDPVRLDIPGDAVMRRSRARRRARESV